MCLLPKKKLFVFIFRIFVVSFPRRKTYFKIPALKDVPFTENLTANNLEISSLLRNKMVSTRLGQPGHGDCLKTRDLLLL